MLRSLSAGLRGVLKRKPWSPSLSKQTILSPSLPHEEERSPHYNAKLFYPARIGEVLDGRYQLALKLGYGSGSTVWLARNLSRWIWQKEMYVAVKIMAIRSSDTPQIGPGELKVLQHITNKKTKHPGRHFVGQLYDNFEVMGEVGLHDCLVYEPLREPLTIYERRFFEGQIPLGILKDTTQMLLYGLDYLHAECGVIHTDIKPNNLLVRFQDFSLLDRAVADSCKAPLPRKICNDGRIIHTSMEDFGPLWERGTMRISDFDCAIFEDGKLPGAAAIPELRAPETILDAPPGTGTDLWALATLVWEQLFHQHPFKDCFPDGIQSYDETVHLALMISLLGPPPKDLLEAGRRTSLFFHPDGSLKASIKVKDALRLENTVSSLAEGEYEQQMFLDFMRTLLTWRPSDRATAGELLKHPWVGEDLFVHD